MDLNELINTCPECLKEFSGASLESMKNRKRKDEKTNNDLILSLKSALNFQLNLLNDMESGRLGLRNISRYLKSMEYFYYRSRALLYYLDDGPENYAEKDLEWMKIIKEDPDLPYPKLDVINCDTLVFFLPRAMSINARNRSLLLHDPAAEVCSFLVSNFISTNTGIIPFEEAELDFEIHFNPDSRVIDTDNLNVKGIIDSLQPYIILSDSVMAVSILMHGISDEKDFLKMTVRRKKNECMMLNT